MRQGATPSYVFTLPISASELDLCHITFKQHFRVIAERNLADCTIDGKKVACTLTEKETLAFLPDCHPAEVQIRCGVGSARFPSQIFKVDVKPALQRSTLAELCGEEENVPTASMPEGEGTAYASQDGWSMAEYDAEFDVDLGELLRGPKGDPGKDGAPGKDGITPTIGENGNWFLGNEDTGKPSRGEKGESAADAVKYTEQGLTDAQKAQARENIDALASSEVAAKTDDMTQPVGVDEDGKLWTAPGGGSVTADGITTALGYTPRKAWYVKLTGTKTSPTADQTAAAIYQAYTDGYAVYGIVQMSEILEGFPIILPLLYAYGSSESVGALCFAGSANPHLSGTMEQNTTITATYDGSWHVFVDSQPDSYTLTDADKTAIAEKVIADGVEATLGDFPTWTGGSY